MKNIMKTHLNYKAIYKKLKAKDEKGSHANKI